MIFPDVRTYDLFNCIMWIFIIKVFSIIAFNMIPSKDKDILWWNTRQRFFILKILCFSATRTMDF